MMKKLFLFALIILFSVPSFSQVKFGLKVGTQTTQTPTYDISSGTTNIEEYAKASWGFHGGAFVRLSLLGIYVQPELLITTNSFDYNVTTSSVTELKTQKFNMLSIPVMVGLKLGPVRINAGPAASIQIGSPEALVSDPDFENMYKGALFGYQAGLGVDLLKKLTFDVRYAGSFGEKFGDSVTVGGQTMKLDHGQPSILFSLGLMF